ECFRTVLAIELDRSRVLVSHTELVLIPRPRDLDATGQRSGRATADHFLVEVSNVGNDASMIVVSLHARQTDSIHAVKPEAPRHLCLTALRLRKLFEQIITAHHPNAFVRSRPRVCFFLKKLALHVSIRAARVYRTNHERVGEMLRTQIRKRADSLFFLLLLVALRLRMVRFGVELGIDRVVSSFNEALVLLVSAQDRYREVFAIGSH